MDPLKFIILKLSYSEEYMTDLQFYGKAYRKDQV